MTDYKDFFANDPERCNACIYHDVKDGDDPCATCVPGTATDHWATRKPMTKTTWEVIPHLILEGVSPANFENLKNRADQLMHQWFTKKQDLTDEKEFIAARDEVIEGLLDAHEMACKVTGLYLARMNYATQRIVQLSQEKPLKTILKGG
jgi:hypothetical protein